MRLRDALRVRLAYDNGAQLALANVALKRELLRIARECERAVEQSLRVNTDLDCITVLRTALRKQSDRLRNAGISAREKSSESAGLIFLLDKRIRSR